MEFEIKELHTRTELKRFVDFPHHLYAGNPYWVPSLRKSELDTLDWQVNPAFEHCRARYWIAESAGRIVGRIAAIINPKHEEVWGQPYMRFGWFDVVDDFDVTQALLDQVEKWAKEEKRTAIHGPLGFTNMDHTGLLLMDSMSWRRWRPDITIPTIRTIWSRLAIVKMWTLLITR